MAQRGIREYDAKKMLSRHWNEYISRDFKFPGKVVLVEPKTSIYSLLKEHEWLGKEKLVVKPDQLFGKRGKLGLIKVNANFDEAIKWIKERMNRDFSIGKVNDKLTHFLIEPFVPHEEEYYIAIKSTRNGDVIYFSNHGGVEIEEVWDRVSAMTILNGEDINSMDIESKLPKDTPSDKKKLFGDFIKGLYRFYTELGYAYLEINPFVLSQNNIIPLDLVARIDDTAHFECGNKWGGLSFPAPFGRIISREEAFIKDMDEKSGASLKLTVLNPLGRIWTMVAGGGASVIYADTIVDLGFEKELANYGEYSGNPTTDETYLYAKTILDLLTRTNGSNGCSKVLLIGGGIANFTDIAKTFKGVTMAITEYRQKLLDNKVKIFVRRGGPNYKEGLKIMNELSKSTGIPIEVYGPETHMTKIVNMGLDNKGVI